MLNKIFCCAALLAAAKAVSISSNEPIYFSPTNPSSNAEKTIEEVTIPQAPYGCKEHEKGTVKKFDGWPFVCEKTDWGLDWMCNKPGSYTTQNG